MYSGITNVFYTESCPDVDYALRWLLDNYNCSISPLHCLDVYDSGPKKGQYKKPHFHVIILNKVSQAQRRTINQILGLSLNSLWQDIKDLQAMEDYQTHNGFADKVVYDVDKVLHSDNYDYHYKSLLPKCSLVENWSRVKSLIEDNTITEISTFNDLLYDQFSDDELFFTFCFKNTLKIKMYIDSIRYRDNYDKQLRAETNLLKKQLERSERFNETLKLHNVNLYKEMKRAKLDSDIKKSALHNMKIILESEGIDFG